jgi:hypothetical protein
MLAAYYVLLRLLHNYHVNGKDKDGRPTYVALPVVLRFRGFAARNMPQLSKHKPHLEPMERLWRGFFQNQR